MHLLYKDNIFFKKNYAFLLIISHLQLVTSSLLLPTCYFLLLTSYLLLPTCYLLLLPCYFLLVFISNVVDSLVDGAVGFGELDAAARHYTFGC